MDKLNLEIKDFRSINEANIEINKINVIGGVNGSGKSTVSRIFYSFLKANSVHRKDFILKNVITRTNKIIDEFNNESNEYNLRNLTQNDDLSYIVHTLEAILEISKDYDKLANLKKEEFIKKFNIFKERLIKDKIDVSILDDKINSIDNEYYMTHDFVDFLFKEYNLNLDYLNDYLELKNIWKSFQYYMSNIHDNCLEIYSEMKEFLIEDNPSVSEKIFNRIISKEHQLEEPFSFKLYKNFDLKMIMDIINRIIDWMNPKSAIPPLPDYLIEEITFDLPDFLTVENNFSDITKTLDILLEISKDHDKILNSKKKELKKQLISKFESIKKILISKNIDVSDIESAVYSTNDNMYVDSEYSVHSIFEEHDLFLDYSDDYFELDELVNSYNHCNLFSNVNDMCVAIESVIHKFFDEEFLSQNDKTINELLLTEDYFKEIDDNINFHISSECDSFGYFFNNFINCVYYIDNVSIFDINHKEMALTYQLFHMNELIEDIYGDTYTYELNKDFKNIMDKIDIFLGGRYDQESPSFVFDKENDSLSFLTSLQKNVVTSNTSTPSGIKQIGIVQLLLLNNKLKKGGYLIIDEPEVNLHPEWQFKFAEILVLLAKELDITIYLNSHSPTFIESIDAFAEFYDMEDYVNYYLTEKSEIEGKFNFNKINSDELYKVYSNLGNVYDKINKLRIRKKLRNRG